MLRYIFMARLLTQVFEASRQRYPSFAYVLVLILVLFSRIHQQRPPLKWLRMPNNLIFLGLHIVISKRQSPPPLPSFPSDASCREVYSNSFMARSVLSLHFFGTYSLTLPLPAFAA